MKSQIKINKITILGAGAFGFAFAKLLESKADKYEIYLYDINESYISHLKQHKKHKVFHRDVYLSEKIIPTSDYDEAVNNTDIYIIAIPSAHIRNAMKQLNNKLEKENTNKHKIFLNLSKALEKNTNKRISQIIDEEITHHNKSIATLSGGMIAREVVLNYPLSADIASKNKNTLKTLKHILETETFKLRTTEDIIGVELAGSFKNVVAIGSGIYKGLGFKESSISAFISEISKEVQNLAIKMGAKKETFEPGSQSWWGDVLTTSFGDSRNKYFGELIGQGYKKDEALDILKKENKISEGYNTLATIHNLIKKYNVNTPLINKIYRIVFENKEPETIYN